MSTKFVNEFDGSHEFLKELTR